MMVATSVSDLESFTTKDPHPPPQQEQEHPRPQPHQPEIRLPAKAATHTLGSSNDYHIAALSVHTTTTTSDISLPEPYDCSSSGSSSASYSQGSATRFPDAVACVSEKGGITDDGRHRPRPQNSQKLNRRHGDGDPEKQQTARQGMHSGDAGLHWRHVGTVTMDHELAINEAEIEKATPNILIFLAIVNPLLSLVTCLYTLIIVTFLTVSLPLQLCTKVSPFATRFTSFLSPFIRLQCRLIHSLLEGDADACRPIRLLLLHLVSPLLALGTALAAWVAAVFWVYAAMLGDPDGRGRGDDGRRAVLSVRRYWERILGWALR